MLVILDTHLFIYREFEKGLPENFQKLLTTINNMGIQIYAHPLSVQEVEQDANIKNRQIILSKVKIVDSPPDANADDEFLRIVGDTDDLRDDVDNQLLYFIYKNATDYLITEDRDIHRKSRKVGISDRVFTVDQAVNEIKNRYEARESSKADKPVFCFFKTGEYWEIGDPYNPKRFKTSKGIEFIQFLLKAPNKSFSPFNVYNLGKTSIMHSEVLENDNGIRQLDRFELKERNNLIKQYKKVIDEQDYAIPEDAVWFEKEIQRLEMEIKKKQERDRNSPHEKCRINVYRRIDSALKKIHKHLPEIKSFLNRTTIKTGDLICYIPIEGAQPTWILRQEDHPPKKSRHS
jgi:predicted nucleic acid-binding protein